ncbi:MAG: hypothetical protein KKF62_05265 [Bacteroidetes bacterium]|nr:hypothetical protein [Bacteroidota bacterium]MBU1116982.1 hypothetical protein [Bacteroidota bacterium]MBU1799049.1 hypothetical protein [Bacteroidota bacterium]
MRKIFLIGLIIAGFVITSCNDSAVEPDPTEMYLYKSYDSTGIKIVEGWITINFTDSLGILGEWELKKVGNSENIGPQVGTGKLVGSKHGDLTFVELNPQFIDNNLILTGTLEQGKYVGEWQYISYVGITNYGTFEANKK